MTASQQRGDMVVYCAGFPAIYGRQPLYFEDPTFAARAAIPPPKRSDSLFGLPVSEVANCLKTSIILQILHPEKTRL
jgi:hypothetical protein